MKLRSRDKRLRVLLVDEGFIGSLHTAVALSDRDCDVVLAGAVGGAAEYQHGFFHSVACPIPQHRDFIPRIHALLSESEFDVVYPTTEPTLLLLADDPVCGPLVFPRLDDRQRRCIVDKQVMVDLAASLGVSVPSTQRMSQPKYPVVVKAERGRGGDAVFIVANAAELERASASVRRMGREPVVQQYIDGPTYLVGGVFDCGEAVRMYTGRKVRQQPARTGPASVIESEDRPELIEAARTIFRELQWTGLGSCDFVCDGDGRSYFLEVNPRPWGSIAAAADAGVELFGPLKLLMEGDSAAVDLRFTAGVRTEVFPLFLLDWAYRLDPRTLLRIRRDLRRHELWQEVRFLRHVLYRLQRVRDNWPGLPRS